MDNKKPEQDTGIIGKFSIALGLFDYINPILYCITSITLLKNMYGVMATPLYIFYALGVCVSMVFGLSIPTVKVIVGTGKMQFKMPVNLVSYVNTGIFISGLMLFGHVFAIKPAIFAVIVAIVLGLLWSIYKKTGKFKLSRRVLTPKPEGYVERERRPRPERGERHDNHRDNHREKAPRKEE